MHSIVAMHGICLGRHVANHQRRSLGIRRRCRRRSPFRARCSLGPCGTRPRRGRPLQGSLCALGLRPAAWHRPGWPAVRNRRRAPACFRRATEWPLRGQVYRPGSYRRIPAPGRGAPLHAGETRQPGRNLPMVYRKRFARPVPAASTCGGNVSRCRKKRRFNAYKVLT